MCWIHTILGLLAIVACAGCASHPPIAAAQAAPPSALDSPPRCVTFSGYLSCQIIDVGLGPQPQWTLLLAGTEYEVAVGVERCQADAHRFERSEVSAEGRLIVRPQLPPLLLADRIGPELPGDHALATRIPPLDRPVIDSTAIAAGACAFVRPR